MGSIYITTDETDSPITRFGGNWVQLKDRFLLGAGDIYNNGATGGSANAICVEHTHNQVKLCLSSGSGYNYRQLSVSQANYNSDATSDIVGRTGGANIGEDGTGKNMPPYLVVYIWKRLAD